MESPGGGKICSYLVAGACEKTMNNPPDGDEKLDNLLPGDNEEFLHDEVSSATPLCCPSGENNEKPENGQTNTTIAKRGRKNWIARMENSHN